VLSKSIAALVSAAAALTLLVGVLAGEAGVPDRLDRFRALAAARLAPAQLTDETAAETYREIYSLFDEEIVESLGSGSVFASTAFLQDRLDAFSEAWGATVVQLRRVGRLLVGAFQLSDSHAGNSVRVYGALHGEPALLDTISREGHPTLYELPPSDGLPQFLVAWEGAVSGRGSRALLVDQLRQAGDGVRTVWSTAEMFPDGLAARGFSVGGSEIRIKYELRYPGWAPGCDGQTEQEDVYRLAPGTGTFIRAGRRQYNAWHRDFRVAVGRLFSALSSGDRATLTGLVPDATIRSRLPLTLRAEPACDAPNGTNPDSVSVAATAEHGPWQLTFHRNGTRWRLVSAAPVIQ
jgi:hypothetical protein